MSPRPPAPAVLKEKWADLVAALDGDVDLAWEITSKDFTEARDQTAEEKVLDDALQQVRKQRAVYKDTQRGKTMAKPSHEYDALERQIQAAGWDIDDCDRIFDEWVDRGYKAAAELITRYKAAGTKPSPRGVFESLVTGQPLPTVKAERQPDLFEQFQTGRNKR